MSAVTHDMTDREVLVAVGEALYGAGWQARIGPPLGLSRSLVYAVVAEDRTLTANARARLVALCESQPVVLADELTKRLRLLADAAAVLRGR